MLNIIGLCAAVFLSNASLKDTTKIHEFYVLSGHKAGISSLAFSPDGSYLVSGSQDESLRIWDLSTRKEKKTIDKLGSPVTSLVFSLNGDMLALGQYSRIKVFKTNTWKKKYQRSIFSAFVENLAISPDGKQLAASSWKDQSLATMEFPDLSKVRELKETNWTDALSYSKDGQFLISGSHSNAIKIWDPVSGSLINQFQNHTDWVYGCFFFQGNNKIVSAGLDSQIVVSDAKTGKVLQKKKAHKDGISFAGISPDEKLFITVSLDKTLRIWDLESFELLGEFSEPRDKLITLAISPDGKWLATGGSDQNVYLIRIR